MCLFTGEDPKVLRGHNEPSLGAHFSITKKKKLVQETAPSSPKKRNLSGDLVEERQNDETSSRV